MTIICGWKILQKYVFDLGGEMSVNFKHISKFVLNLSENKFVLESTLKILYYSLKSVFFFYPNNIPTKMEVQSRDIDILFAPH